MLNATPLTLRNESVYLKELTIGEVIEIAKIPEEMNELRINAFLSYVCDDKSIAYRLTVQERYYILLNYLTVSQSNYMDSLDVLPFLMEKKQADDFVFYDGIYIKSIYGNEVSALQKKCENAYEWLAGQMVFGIYGDVGRLFNCDDPMIWHDSHLMDDNRLDDELKNRFDFINNLTDSQFNLLYDLYQKGQEDLSHFVELGLDNDGITLLGKEGSGAYQVGRFRPLEMVSGVVRELVNVIKKSDY